MDNLNASFKIAEMIFREVRNEISEEEKTALHNWLGEDPANKELYQKIINQKFLGEKLKTYNKYNSQLAWHKVSRQIRKPSVNKIIKLRKFLSYAAVVLPALIAGYLIIQKTVIDRNNQLTDVITIQTGTQKALLTLSNGTKLELDNSTEEAIVSEQEADITDVDNTLNYIAHQGHDDTKQEVYNTLETPKGGEYSILLSDGTRIWLNAATKLSYPVMFTGDKRKVHVEGEAYFEVAENRKKPFVVSTGKMDIEVLGTSFNVMSYSNEENIQTTLVEGKVRVNSTEKSKRNQSALEIHPGEQGIFEKANNRLISRQVDTKIYTAWKDGKFVVANETLEDFMRSLERWYNYETEYSSDELRNYHFSGTLDRYSDVSEILELISLTTDLSFEIKGKTILVKKKL